MSTAILFLILYAVIVLPYVENAYPGDHGEDVSLWGNTFRQFFAQKILWFGLAVLCYRIYLMFVKKDPYEFWDSMILAGFGYCVGCAILKLNWVLYYSSASLFMLPAIVHYMSKYLDVKRTAIILSLLALFMSRKMPQNIIGSQKIRKSTTMMMNIISDEYSHGNKLYWFEPIDNRPWCNDLEIRSWLRESVQTQIGRQINDENFSLNIVHDFNADAGVYILPSINDKVFPSSNDAIINKGDVLYGFDLGNSLSIVRVNQ